MPREVSSLKTRVILELTAPGKYVEMKKELDLPFPPFRNLNLQFPGISTDHPNVERYRQARQKGFIPVGTCTIETVWYVVHEEMFIVTASEGYATKETLDAAVEQLLYGYEFEIH